MKVAKIIMLVMMMTVVMSSLALAQPGHDPENLEFNEGLKIVGNDFDKHEVGENLTLHVHLFDAKSGVSINPSIADCQAHLFTTGYEYEDVYMTEFFEKEDMYRLKTTIPGEYLNKTDDYGIILWCNSTQLDNTGSEVYKGGEAKYLFSTFYEVKTSSGTVLWQCPTEWTFPIIYLILTLIMLFVAYSVDSTIMGILGSLMLIFSYLYIGACSPLLLSPLMIVGILLAVRFATK